MATAGCAQASAPTALAGSLTGLEFVSPTRGWAVGQNTILTTSDGGAHWTTQLSGDLNLTSVDFISASDGWAVGATTLLATTDGGAHWTALPEPCQPIRSVHFTSPTAGVAVAGGSGFGAAGLGPTAAVPLTGGTLLVTSDGGRTWHAPAASANVPADVQSACFSGAQQGWLGADGQLYRTADGGAHWAKLTSAALPTGDANGAYPATMSVECANGTAWAERVGPGAAMNQSPHIGYYANFHGGAVPLFAEQYFQNGAAPKTESPGSEAGPFSAIDSATAAFVDWCPACGAGTAPWALVSNSGTAVGKMGNVGSITQPLAASFQSAQVGSVAGTYTVISNTAKDSVKSQQRIVGTTDGGRTWHVEWAGPWTTQG